MHPSTQFEEMSNLSTTSVVTALEVLQNSFLGALREFQNSIGMAMRTISKNMEKLLEKCLRELTSNREILRDIVLSMKEMLTRTQQPLFF